MARRRGIFAFIMVAVYIIATMLSSVSLLMCDEHHGHIHSECHTEHCACHGTSIDNDCCDHHHPILGDNHTDFIDSSQRGNSRTASALALMLAPVIINVVSGEQSLYGYSLFEYERVSKIGEVLSSHSLGVALRAPPVLA